MIEFRCSKCNKLLAKFVECDNLEIKCSRCGTQNTNTGYDLPAHSAISNTRPFLASG